MRGRCGSKRRRPCGGSTRAKPSETCRVAGGQPPTASTLVTSPGSNAHLIWLDWDRAVRGITSQPFWLSWTGRMLGTWRTRGSMPAVLAELRVGVAPSATGPFEVGYVTEDGAEH